MPTYRVVVKGNTTQAIYYAQRNGFAITGIVQNGAPDGSGNTILTVEHSDPSAIVQWLGATRSQPPFPPGELLFYRDEDSGTERKKVWLASQVPGYKMDDDLDGLSSWRAPQRTQRVTHYFVGNKHFEVFETDRDGAFNVDISQPNDPSIGGYKLLWSAIVYSSSPDMAAVQAASNAALSGDISYQDLDALRNYLRLNPAQRQRVQSEKGYKMDDDLDGLEAAGKFHPWSVSTLVPGFRGQPKYMYFDEYRDALAYAKDRARKGKRLRDGGRAYFVLDNVAGGVTNRVFRAFLGAEQRKGSRHYAVKREFVIVQKAKGTLPHDPSKTHWVMDKASSEEILNDSLGSIPPRPRRETMLIELLPGTSRERAGGDVDDRAAVRLAALKRRGIQAQIVYRRDGSLAIRLPDGSTEEV